MISMKKYMIFILFVFIILACEKKESMNVDAPLWLNEMVNDMESESTYIAAEFWRYSWNGDYYYELTSPIFSCLYCNVFDSQGNRMDWEIANLDDFIKDRKDKTFIWKEPELE